MIDMELENKEQQTANAMDQENNQQEINSQNPVEELTEHTEGDTQEADNLTAELSEITQKYESLIDENLRLRAEFDNFRKRTIREKAELIKCGGEDTIKKIIPVIDDLERGIDAVNNASDIEALKQGMELIYNKFKNFLDQQNVKEIPAKGLDFDLEEHEAITMMPAPTPELKGKVVECVEKGYKLNDKVIRFAKVIVGQ